MIDEKKTVVQTNHVLRLFIQLKGRKPNEDGNVLGEWTSSTYHQWYNT